MIGLIGLFFLMTEITKHDPHPTMIGLGGLMFLIGFFPIGKPRSAAAPDTPEEL